MKLVIPSKCQLGAIGIDICFSDKILKKMDLTGYINSKEQTIRLSHRRSDQEWVVLIHEALHGITDECGISFDGDREAAITSLANGIAIFLNSLGIEPDFSQVPEEKL